jgi:hypothetical protein
MAKSSFSKELQIKDDATADAMLKAMENASASKHGDKSNFSKDLESGNLLLQKRFSHKLKK